VSVRITAIGLGIFAVYLPVAAFVHRNYVQAPRPDGSAVELMTKIYFDRPDHYAIRSYAFNPNRFPDVSRVTVYEDTTPLPKESVEIFEDLGSYVVRFQASDGSDPRNNGRQYWTVMPSD
jgi:hypothetical protein